MLAPQGIPAGGEANVPAWELMDSYEDSDAGTAFDYNITIDNTRDMYLIYYRIIDMGFYTANVYLRVNGDDSSSYEYVAEDGTATSGETAAQCAYIETDDKVFGYILTGDGNIPYNQQPGWLCYAVSGKVAGYLYSSGRLKVEYGEINQIRLYTDSDAIGWLKLYGLNH